MSSGALALALLAALAVRAPAQQRGVQERVVVGMAAPLWTEQQIDQLVFAQFGSPQSARLRLEDEMRQRLGEIDRTCILTDPQRQKLGLAARGDIKRFYERVDAFKAQIRSADGDNNQAVMALQNGVNVLRVSLQNGIFHEDSLFYKALHSTLTPEQLTRQEAAARAKREERHRESIDRAIRVFTAQGVRLSDAERRGLIALLTKETRPSRRASPYELYFILAQLGRLPGEPWQAYVDQQFHPTVRRLIAQYRDVVPRLRDMGYLSPDTADEDAAPAAEGGSNPRPKDGGKDSR